MLSLEELPLLEPGLDFEPLVPELLLAFIAASYSEREIRPSPLVSALEKSSPLTPLASL